MSCGGGHRRGSDPKLLWLWYKPEAVATIQPLSWEPPYATGMALKKRKKFFFNFKKTEGKSIFLEYLIPFFQQL